MVCAGVYCNFYVDLLYYSCELRLACQLDVKQPLKQTCQLWNITAALVHRAVAWDKRMHITAALLVTAH